MPEKYPCRDSWTKQYSLGATYPKTYANMCDQRIFELTHISEVHGCRITTPPNHLVIYAVFRERSLFMAGGGRCKSENHVHSKCAPPSELRFCPPLVSRALKFCPPYHQYIDMYCKL